MHSEVEVNRGLYHLLLSRQERLEKKRKVKIFSVEMGFCVGPFDCAHTFVAERVTKCRRMNMFSRSTPDEIALVPKDLDEAKELVNKLSMRI